MANNLNRATKLLHRATGADDWTEMSWGEAVPLIAQRIKETRDATFKEKNDADRTVNRTLGI